MKIKYTTNNKKSSFGFYSKNIKSISRQCLIELSNKT